MWGSSSDQWSSNAGGNRPGKQEGTATAIVTPIPSSGRAGVGLFLSNYPLIHPALHMSRTYPG